MYCTGYRPGMCDQRHYDQILCVSGSQNDLALPLSDIRRARISGVQISDIRLAARIVHSTLQLLMYCADVFNTFYLTFHVALSALDMIAALGETTGGPALQAMQKRMQCDPVGQEILR